jgi:hypothetical protein
MHIHKGCPSQPLVDELQALVKFLPTLKVRSTGLTRGGSPPVPHAHLTHEQRVNQVVAPILVRLERHRCTQGVIHSNAVHCRRLCAQTATLAAAAAGFAPLPRVPSHRTQWDPEMHPSATTPVTALGVRSTALPPLHHRASPLPRPRPPVFSRFQRVTTRAVLSLVHF